MTGSTPSMRRLVAAAAALPLAGALLVGGIGPAAANTTEPAEPAAPECVASTVTLDRTTITATDVVGLTVRTAPGSTVDLYAYSRPSTTFARVRTAEVGDDGVARFAVRPGGNTRLYAQQRGCTADVQRDSVVLLVRPLLGLTSANRVATRSYSFSGTSLPARPGGLVVNLYRINADGTQVLTASTRASAVNGSWRFDRRFTGSGRFGFMVRSSPDIMNPTGQSNTRSVLIY